MLRSCRLRLRPESWPTEGIGLSMTGRGQYSTTDLNMDRLLSYAKKVARETRAAKTASIHGKRASKDQDHGIEVELFGPHWSLLQVTSNGETDDYPTAVAEWHMRKHWILAPDGSLHTVEYYEKFAQYGSLRGSWRFESTVRPMNPSDVLELDHEHPSQSGGNRAKKERWWGNYSAGRLRSHAAGVGASIALKRLLDAD